MTCYHYGNVNLHRSGLLILFKATVERDAHAPLLLMVFKSQIDSFANLPKLFIQMNLVLFQKL